MDIYHFIDHKGEGTIHQLLAPFNDYSNHYIFSLDDANSFVELFEMKQQYNENKIIIHTSGGGGSVLLDHLFFSDSHFNNVFVFLHTSLKYQLYKNRLEFIEKLKYLFLNKHIGVLVPSICIVKQLSDQGIFAKPVQLGIKLDKDLYLEDRKQLAPYYNKIVTTCASQNPDYQYVKGVDVFVDMLSLLHLEKESLIAGSKIEWCDNIVSKFFPKNDFLNILSHSIAYVQMSRFESYNITAVQAKQLKIPVFLLSCEGNVECMSGNVYDSAGVKKCISNITSGIVNKDLIENLYQDSIRRESFDSFRLSLEKKLY